MEDMFHSDARPLSASEESSTECGCLDIGSGHGQLRGEKIPVDSIKQFFSAGRLLRQCQMPECEPFLWSRLHEVDDETQTTQEGCIHISLAVGCQNSDTIKLLHALQEIVDLDIGKAIVSILDLCSLPKES